MSDPEFVAAQRLETDDGKVIGFVPVSQEAVVGVEAAAPPTLPMPVTIKAALLHLSTQVLAGEAEVARLRREANNIMAAFLSGVVLYEKAVDGVEYDPDFDGGVFRRR